jgi:hypothetical protein
MLPDEPERVDHGQGGLGNADSGIRHRLGELLGGVESFDQRPTRLRLGVLFDAVRIRSGIPRSAGVSFTV